MEFSTQENMALPASAAFEMLSTFEQIEAAAMRRGMNIRRVDDPERSGVGMKWQAQFVMQGRGRVVDAEVVKHEPPQEMVLELVGQGLHGKTRIELIAVSPGITRVIVDVVVQSKTLTARILLQTLKLTKSKLDSRFRKRVAQYIQELEQHYNQTV